MKLEAGTRVGHYEVLSALGAGGMGEVYRARDTQLKRDVALKVLPEAFSEDADRLARFKREAELLASLNHPHIAAVHGLETSASGVAIVMELVDGPTLADRLASGPLALDDALTVARQIAEALEAAHDKGIIHRDLKPANVKIAADGRVKVLDFGLAKLQAGDTGSSSGHLSFSPTMTSPVGTIAGTLLGTAAYMSPEQARGQNVDRRTDIFSLGCVLFEMLTGTQAFPGDTITDILATVLKGEPNWSALPAGTPPSLRKMLRRSMEKDRLQRLQSAGDVRIEIDEIRRDASEPAPVEGPQTSRTRERAAWTVAALAVVSTVVLAGLSFAPTEPPAEMRLELATPPSADPLSMALSPDGRKIVFPGIIDGKNGLWVRSLDDPGGRLLPGTDGAQLPFWSPASDAIAFFSGGKLRRIDVDGGAPQTLADAAVPRGGSWSATGVILFAPASAVPLSSISADGGAVTNAAPLQASVSGHRFPSFLPDGRHYVFFGVGTEATEGIYLGSLDSPEMTRLTDADTSGIVLPNGRLLYVRQGALVARQLDLDARALVGESETVADAVTFDPNLRLAAVSAAATGLIAYRPGGANRRQLTWFDRAGTRLGTLGDADESGIANVEVSPDGKRVAIDRTVQGNTDVWIVDDVRTTRLTFDAAIDHWPVWSPDGATVAFDSSRRGEHDLFVKPASGAGDEELLFGSKEGKGVASWSPDGNWLLFDSQNPKTNYDVWVMALKGDRTPRPFLQTPFVERQAQFSPDGRWVAYESTESGRPEIYIRPFPGPGGQWQASSDGGISPEWSASGRELFYVSPDGAIMAVPVTINGAGVEPGAPAGLFRPQMFGAGTSTARGQYAAARDGRFLVNMLIDDSASRPVVMLINWTPGQD